MRSFAAMLLLAPSVLGFPSRASEIVLKRRDGPRPITEIQDGQTGTLMVLPPQATETGLKQIPGRFYLNPTYESVDGSH
jgi:hypothetical protein